ncbi:19535_t:CDS:1, partial [Gigaspora margarita]
ELCNLEKNYITNKKITDLDKAIAEFYRIREKVYDIEKKFYNAAEITFKNKNKCLIWELKAAWHIFHELSKSKFYEIYSKANYYLDCCYENEIGCNKNIKLAKIHLELAINASNKDA